MTFLALALGLGQIQAPTLLHARIVSAAVFKPGLAMIVREAEVPAGSGSYFLDDLPNAIDGSFWFGSPDMVEFSDMNTAIRLSDEAKTYDAKTIPELIFANQGKHLTIKIPKGSELETLSGVLTNLEPRNGAMTLKLDSGAIRSVAIAQIVEIDPTGLATSYTQKGKVPTLRIVFKASAPKTGHIRVTSIETGAAWTASYLLDLGADNFGRIEGKAQLGLGALKFENTDVKLMAGFPKLPSNAKYDLASGFGSLDAYLHGNQTYFAGNRPGGRDPYDLFATWLQQMRESLGRYMLATMVNPYYGTDYNGLSFGGGGFGGFGGPGGAGYNNSQSGQLLPNDVNLVRTESLYSYPIGGQTLEPGDRLTKLLFEQHSPYRTIYHWEANFPNNPVTQLLRFHNTSKSPWTGGIATVTKNGLPLAQTDMPFTAVGKDANLVLGEAPDIVMDRDTQEVKAEPIPDPKRPTNIYRTKITEETRISAENTKDEPVTIEVTMDLVGEVKTEGAQIEKLPRRHGDINPRLHVTWQLHLAAGEQKRITLTNVYLR